MGVRHSKPHARRRRRKGGPTSERQSPEGGPCPTASPPSPLDQNRSCIEACPCNKARHDATEERDRPFRDEDGFTKMQLEKTATNHDDVSAGKVANACDYGAGLRVHLPDLKAPTNTFNSTPCVRKSTAVERVSAATNEKGETEWTISFDNNKGTDAGRSRDEELFQIMNSIRDALDSGIGQYSQGQNRLRVRLSVTPEPKSSHRLRQEEDDVSISSRQTSKSDDETKRRCRHERNDERKRTDTHARSRRKDENDQKSGIDRQQHYRQIPGVDKDEPNMPDTPASQPHRQTDKTTSRSRSRERHHVCSSKQHCCRGHRYQSPFDQRFQEAMYLRLRELQRDSAWEERLTTRKLSDSESSSSESSSDSEYSGDNGRDDTSRDQSQVSRIFEPLSSTSMHAITHSTERRIEFGVERSVSFKQQNTISVSGVEINKQNPSATCTPDSATTRKSWEGRSLAKTDARRKFTKTRKKSPGPSKANHGYLRANVLPPGATSAFPNTPRLASLSPLQGLVQRHQHEHIHHHYYYHGKPKS